MEEKEKVTEAEAKGTDKKPRFFDKQAMKYTLIVIAFAAAVFWGVMHTDKVFGFVDGFLDVISPFIVGFCIAFVINLVLNPLERLWEIIFKKVKTSAKLKRAICLLLATLLVFGAVFAIIFMIIPQIETTVTEFVSKLPGYFLTLENLWDDTAKWLEGWNIVLPEFALDYKVIGDFLKGLIENYGGNFIDTTVGITAAVLGGIVNFVLSLAFSIYLLAEKEKVCCTLVHTIDRFLPKKAGHAIIDIAVVTNNTFTRFVAGQLMEACIIGFLCLIGMLVFGMPYAPVVSLLVGTTALIPMFGAFFGTAVGAFFILLVDPMKAVWFVVFIIVLQQLEGQPHISQGGGQIRPPAGHSRAGFDHRGRRPVRHRWYAVRRAHLLRSLRLFPEKPE